MTLAVPEHFKRALDDILIRRKEKYDIIKQQQEALNEHNIQRQYSMLAYHTSHRTEANSDIKISIRVEERVGNVYYSFNKSTTNMFTSFGPVCMHTGELVNDKN
jgi:hypothetical protein